MKLKNAPGRKNQRRIDAWTRLSYRYPKIEGVRPAHATKEIAILEDRIRDESVAQAIRTKKVRTAARKYV